MLACGTCGVRDPDGDAQYELPDLAELWGEDAWIRVVCAFVLAFAGTPEISFGVHDADAPQSLPPYALGRVGGLICIIIGHPAGPSALSKNPITTPRGPAGAIIINKPSLGEIETNQN